MPSWTEIPGSRSGRSTHRGWLVVTLTLAVGCGDVAPDDAAHLSHNSRKQHTQKQHTQKQHTGDQNTQARPLDTPRELLADPLVPPIDLQPVAVQRTSVDEPGDTSPVLRIQRGPDSWDANRSLFSSDSRARFEPHGDQVCASGCAASRHPTPQLDTPDFHKLMAAYRFEPMDASSTALESLLFYGRQTQQLLDQHGDRPLDASRAKFLRRELRRTHAMIAFRIVDQRGRIRTQMPPTRVPLDRRHVFDMENTDLPPLVTSGTVKRVGLHHLWTRI